MPNIGLPELIVIAMILVLVFGASRLPQLGEGMGKAIRRIKRGLEQDDRIEAKPVAPADEPPRQPAPGARQHTLGGDEPTDAEIVDDTKPAAKETS
ncbi:MAG: twin-arginine translocase TatA/TatE family subunit [Myxococcales bacterium]|nr:twin-arginine translocase TatA/TatE family subunit [Myxococcales bacterium]MDD9968942.1 twin-arginine translocase TatA/TatE family subunit [Myxococcales bacterium]